MPRTADERIPQAKQLFDTGMLLKDIANQLDVPAGTIRRWKSTYNWDSERSKKQSERSQKNNERSKRNNENKKTKKKAIAREVDQVTENGELTDQQRLFCIYYIRCFNATKAYQKAYKCSYETAMAAGSRMLRNVKVVEQITELKKDQMNKTFLSEQDIFNKYIDIVFADMKDYVSWGQKKVPLYDDSGVVEVRNPKTGKKEPLMQDVNTVNLMESSEVDGTLVTEIKQGKEGITIKLADKMRALQWLSDHMDLATQEQRTRIEFVHAKTMQLSGEDKNNDVINRLDDIFEKLEDGLKDDQ